MEHKKNRNTKVIIPIIILILITLIIPAQTTLAEYMDVTFTPTNQPPIILNEIPNNGSRRIGLKPNCSIHVIDPDGHLMDIYWYEKTTGNWVLRHKEPKVGDGIYQYNYYQFNKYSTTYYWKVAVNDSCFNTTAIFHFTTSSSISKPNINPIAKITGQDQGYVNQTLIFYSYDSYDPDGIITGYRWDFNNDGLFDTDWIEEIYVIYKYLEPGNYTIRLMVKDTMFATATDTHTITILQLEPTQQLPIAEANGPYEGHTNEAVDFSSEGSYDINGTIVNYTWYFGDNQVSYLANPSHTYYKPGHYLVLLVVRDNENLANMDIAIVNITDKSVEPIIKEKELSLCIPLFLILVLIATIIVIIIYKKRRKN